ncbi:MAG: ABC-F family ATP-binding cassette domain-containing protein [Anaerovoracaceae bacterium]
MIKVDNLSYSFPKKDLYNKISFTIESGQHCAFIGVSGSGKSTLVDIIMNPEKYMFDGELEISPSWKIGYVRQFYKTNKTGDVTVFEYIGSECIKVQNELTAICAEMEKSLDIEPLLLKYQETLEAFDALGGNDLDSQINKKLNLANLSHLKDLMISKLSGGEFKLIQVIKEMLGNPELIIMDEPDVFLDFENINSLKNLINNHKGALLVITHNRYLLHHCFNKIIHLENMELQEFDGRYIDYNFSLLESKIELQELATIDEEEIRRNQALIHKLRCIATDRTEPAKGASLKARVKIKERLEARKIKQPFVHIKQPVISLNTDTPIVDTIGVSVDNYSVAFDKIILANVSFEIGSNDKVALIGPNGSGKTTLLRELFKNTHDSIHINEDVEIAYLSQLQGEMLDESNTIFQEFFQCGFETQDTIITYLSNYGFEEEILSQKIGSLSGGEKNILQLAKVSTSKANMLLLDEPTSHLDTYSQIALENAIENYNGSILMISHDFYSIINCMDFVLIIEDKTVRKMNMRKFRKMIYASHFDVDYLELEKKKKSLETQIGLALHDNDYTLAKTLSTQLKALIKAL